MIEANFTVTPSAGNVLATEFLFTNNSTGDAAYKYIWDFGDNSGLVYNEENPIHVYKYPGSYVATLTAVDYDGNVSINSSKNIAFNINNNLWTDYDYITYLYKPVTLTIPDSVFTAIVGEDVIWTIVNPSGNITSYNTFDASFIPELTGVYFVTVDTLTADSDENIDVFSYSLPAITAIPPRPINVDFVYRDYVTFTQIPETYANPGLPTSTPFEISVISSNVDKPLNVDLFAANSNSTPYNFVPNKWSFLTPTWKFLDLNGNTINTISIDPIPVYKNNIVVAVSGTAKFYYVDSMSTGDPTRNCPIILTATLQTSGFNFPNESNIYPYNSYTNNETVKAALAWQVNDLFPNLLKITSNYISDITPTQWNGIKIPTLITYHSKKSLIIPDSDDTISGVIFSYPLSNAIGDIDPLTITLPGLSAEQYILEEPFNVQSTDSNGSRTAGYVFTTATVLTSISNTSIAAKTVAHTGNTYTTGKFSYPYGYAPDASVWVSNPEKNTLNKITLVPYPDNCKTINHFKDKNILIDGNIKEIQVPALSTTNTFNYTLSGFSGIYGMAVDPRNFDLIACDAELDRIYRYSNTGKLLKTFELSSLGDYNSKKKMFDHWSWQTWSPYASASNFNFYSPTIKSTNPKNYIAILGGLIQPTEFIRITPTNGFRIVDTVPGDFSGYPPENVTLNALQIFSPSLPAKYINSISTWTLSSTDVVNSYTLENNNNLKTDSSYYIVSIDGILQSPLTYTIDKDLNTITFSDQLSEDLIPEVIVTVTYLPEILPPATWYNTFSYPVTSFSLSDIPINNSYETPRDYIPDKESWFIVNIGGVMQMPTTYTLNLTGKQLKFDQYIPADVEVSVTQIAIPDVIDNPAAYTPAYVSLDRDSNIWVSLYNTVSVLKFDKNLNLLFNVVPENINWQYRSNTVLPLGIDYQAAEFGAVYTPVLTAITEPSFDYYTNEFFLKPPAVETDKNSDCWVTYAHPLCSIAVKYGKNGNYIQQIPLAKYSTPVNLAINSDNNLWISNEHSSSYFYTFLSGGLSLYDTKTSSLVKTVTGITRPSNLCLDRDNNLWFTHGTRRIGHYVNSTSSLYTWTLDLTGGFTNYTLPLPLSALETIHLAECERDEELGGLAVDVHNRVWVLDSIQNQAWVISATSVFQNAPIRHFKIIPDVNLGYYNDLNNDGTYTETGDYYFRSAQATGDWTGNRWYQKYATFDLFTTLPLSGISSPFTVSEFKNDYQIRRVNESFNNAEYFKSLALPEVLKNNNKLFDEFFAAAVGTGELRDSQDLGQTVFERIANFTLNHSDIDTCNIDQLLSLADQIGTPATVYGANYPVDIKNMLDIASVPRAKLWGVENNIPLMPQSIGKQYIIETDYIVAGEKIILKDKTDSSITIIDVPALNNLSVYPLSSFEGFGFVQPVLYNYNFYRFTPVYSNEYIENVIDWNSPYTTLQPSASTLQEWYGENGAIENAFKYLLTKNLFLK